MSLLRAVLLLAVSLLLLVPVHVLGYWLLQQPQDRQPPGEKDQDRTIGLDNPNEDHYLLLDDHDLTQHGEILKQLASASKEEVESAVNSNPALQEALLKKVDNVVQVKSSDQSNAIGMPAVGSSGAIIQVPKGKLPDSSKLGQIELDNSSDIEEDDIAGPPPMPVVKPGKKKLKLKKKLVKIGAGLKAKLVALSKKAKLVKVAVPLAAVGAPVGVIGANLAKATTKPREAPRDTEYQAQAASGFSPANQQQKQQQSSSLFHFPRFHVNVST